MKRFSKISTLLLAVALCGALLAGCGGGSNLADGMAAQDYPITIQNVTIDKKPEGVVVLSDNLADVILTMGYEITLKGKSAACTQEDLSLLPDRTIDSVGDMQADGVTLVLTDTQPTEAQSAALKDAGISVLVIAPATSREDLTRLYLEVGAAMNGGKTGYAAAQRSAESTLLSVDEISRLIPASATQPTACYLYAIAGEDQLDAATGDTLAGKLLEYAGYTNNFSDSTGGAASFQSLLVGNPEYIFCDTGLKEQLLANSALSGLNAVKNNHVYEIPRANMTRQGRTLFTAAGTLASIAHPEVLSGGSASSVTSEASSSAVSSAPSASSAASSAPTSTSSSTVSVPPDSIQQSGVLQKDDTGSEVLKMQQRLDELGYMYVAPSGTFGGGTVQCLKDFQLYNGLEVTGIADAKTLEKLYSDNVTVYPGDDR